MTDTWCRISKGDKEAFMILYKSHYQSLFCYGFSITADREMTKDCIHDLFLEMWNGRASHNIDVKNVRSYLFTWLRRKIIHEFSKLEKERSNEAHTEELAGSEPSYEDLLIAFQLSEEKKYELKIALGKLTNKQLEIIRLKFFDDLSYTAIAAQTSLAPRTVYNLVYQALRHLRATMRSIL